MDKKVLLIKISDLLDKVNEGLKRLGYLGILPALPFLIAAWLIKQIGTISLKLIKLIYIVYYPLGKDLRVQLRDLLYLPRKRIKELNTLRVKNIEVTFWINSGTVLSLFISLLAFAWSLLWILQNLFPVSSSEAFPGFFMLHKPWVWAITLFLVLATVISLAPILIRRILLFLPSKDYAQLSLTNLNQSEILTLVSYKLWKLCQKFISEVPIPKEISRMVDVQNDFFHADYWLDEDPQKLKKKFQVLNKEIQQFKSAYYKQLSDYDALKDLAIQKLNILPREFCHHIIKFSLSIFERRINIFNKCVEEILFMMENGNNIGDQDYRFVYENNLKEMMRVVEDVKNRRMRSMEQIIAYDDIHEYVIGLSSATSTSESLKIFTRGLSAIAKSYNWAKKEEREFFYKKFKALLYRSKAHYGMDLLISIENFYANYHNEKNKLVPALLKKIATDKSMVSFTPDQQALLENIRDDIMRKYRIAMDAINSAFGIQLSNILANKPKNGTIYFLIFGYSKMVRNVLKEHAEDIRGNNIKVFVMKEDDNEMLDTRMLRFELNDQKPKYNIRESFTASDKFFFRLLTGDDQLIMLAGAEAYDKSHKRLIHTNHYQTRVEALIYKLQQSVKMVDDAPIRSKPIPKVWIIAGKYKIYPNFTWNPQPESFKGELYADHYDKADMYNFEDLGVDVRLITDK